jgi:hypothetical protein
MHEAVEDGIGVGGIADQVMPTLDGRLAGDDGQAAAVSLLDDFEQILARLGVERLQPPIVEDKQFDARQCFHQPGMAAVATGERQFVEQLGDPGVEYGTVIPACLVAERAGQPRFPKACFAAEDDVVVGVDPIAGDKALEQRPVEIADNAVVDILDGGLVPQLGVSQPRGQALVVAVAALAVEQQAEAFGR